MRMLGEDDVLIEGKLLFCMLMNIGVLASPRAGNETRSQTGRFLQNVLGFYERLTLSV